MPLLEINQIRHISASVRLDESTAAEADHDAAFMPASADDVVDTALHCVFSKDRDFQGWSKDATSQAGCIHVTGPKRREQWGVGASGEEASSGVEPTTSVRAVGA